jgi:N-acylneuraminate cytidylyltransferase
MTTVAYAVDPEFVLRADSWREGSVKAVVIPPERAIDIDDELDLQIASCLWELRR